MGNSVYHKLLIKMKVAVVFLACFVGFSLQQAFYQPYPYGQPAFYLNPHAAYGRDPVVDSPNPQGRSNVAVEASDDEKSLAEEGGRLFFGNGGVFTLGGLGFLGGTSTTTATALATTTTTATSASIVSCIPLQPIPIQHGLPQKARHLRRFWSRGSYCPVQEGRGRGQRDSRRRSQARGS